MTVRFRHPVELGKPLVVRAHMASSRTPLYVTEAEILQDGQVKAKATGKFMDRPSEAGGV
jgi:acyl-CoA thioesterase FadM